MERGYRKFTWLGALNSGFESGQRHENFVFPRSSGAHLDSRWMDNKFFPTHNSFCSTFFFSYRVILFPEDSIWKILALLFIQHRRVFCSHESVSRLSLFGCFCPRGKDYSTCRRIPDGPQSCAAYIESKIPLIVYESVPHLSFPCYLPYFTELPWLTVRLCIHLVLLCNASHSQLSHCSTQFDINGASEQHCTRIIVEVNR